MNKISVKLSALFLLSCQLSNAQQYVENTTNANYIGKWDGKSSSVGMFYYGGTSADYNTLTKNGIYRAWGGVNKPSGFGHSTVLVVGQDGGDKYGFQLSSNTDPNNPKLSFRNYSGIGNYGGWNEMLHKGNFVSYMQSINSIGIGINASGNLASGNALAIGDGDTGIKQQGDGILTFFTNNVERMRVDNNGRVGIGTDNPGSSKLSVNGGKIYVRRDLGATNKDFWSNNSHLELSNNINEGGNIVLDFHRSGQSNAAIMHSSKQGLTFVPNGNSGSDNDRVYFSPSGKVGVGTVMPNARLEIMDHGISLGIKPGYLYDGQIMIRDDNAVAIDVPGEKTISFSDEVVFTDGNVGIGTKQPDAPLTVNGTIHAKEVLVDTNIFPDYVFNVTYKLKPLSQVENYIKVNGHLEGFKAEKEIVENGLNLKEITVKQQEKIEELTLYTIEQQKQIEAQKEKIKEIETQKKELETIKAKLAKLEALLK